MGAEEEWKEAGFKGDKVDVKTFVGAVTDLGLTDQEAKKLFQDMNQSNSAGELSKADFAKRYNLYEEKVYDKPVVVETGATTLVKSKAPQNQDSASTESSSSCCAIL
eukprot:TRINITY_DN3357_c0_g1_i7.p1 TRINITY_DN3357_c0_g1~~TRINITY_DN3357_c0_g1_i7.p1  ORF type:complete len:107 (+),score=35.34 TRINITY_DN3357_c0_g1_i7:214-534(+)